MLATPRTRGYRSLFGGLTITNPKLDPDEGSLLSDSAAQRILSYRGPSDSRLVRLTTFGSTEQAELAASVLASEGIPSRGLGENVNALGGFYSGFAGVDLMVGEDDLERAVEILARATEDLEPADESSAAGREGETEQMVVAGAYDSVRAMLDAQVVLASANIPSVTPTLEKRGDRPPGTGKRFLIRVAADDLKLAQSQLQESDDADEPRCPKCGSWRVYPDASWRDTLAEIAGINHRAAKSYECLACKYRGSEAEFLGRR